MTGPWREIIGVVGDERDDGVDQKAPTTVYWPVLMKNFWGDGDRWCARTVTYAVRSSRDGVGRAS